MAFMTRRTKRRSTSFHRLRWTVRARFIEPSTRRPGRTCQQNVRGGVALSPTPGEPFEDVYSQVYDLPSGEIE